MEQIEMTAVAALLEQREEKLKRFKKNTYEASFEEFMEENHTLWTSFRRLFEQEEEPVEEEKAVAECLTGKFAEILEQCRGRMEKEECQIGVNLFMVSYVLPAILACQQYPKKDGHACKMADAICRKWKEEFPKYTIQYADFASIQGGFKQKLCYVTTAVCQSLQKPQDCRELMLMKQYRDTYLLQRKDGEMLIDAYYDIAPTLVKRIEKGENPELKYRYLWETYLKPCVAMIESGANEECCRLYRQMVEELRSEYFVDLRDGGDSHGQTI